MKKTILIIATVLIANAGFSQAVGGVRAGLFMADGSTYFGPGASFQYGINKNIVLGLNFDYHLGQSSSSLMSIEPKVDYYFNSAFNGFHAGASLSNLTNSVSFAGVSVSASQMALGATAGYAHPINDKLFIDISAGGAYMLDSKTMAIRPTLTLGYKFGK